LLLARERFCRAGQKQNEMGLVDFLVEPPPRPSSPLTTALYPGPPHPHCMRGQKLNQGRRHHPMVLPLRGSVGKTTGVCPSNDALCRLLPTSAFSSPCLLRMTSLVAHRASLYLPHTSAYLKTHLLANASSPRLLILPTIELHAPTNSTQKLKLIGKGGQFTYTPTLPLTCSLPQAAYIEYWSEM
jgi:hypothetical protein